MNDNKCKESINEVVKHPELTPDEQPSLNIEAKFKISDPESGVILVEGRA